MYINAQKRHLNSFFSNSGIFALLLGVQISFIGQAGVFAETVQLSPRDHLGSVTRVKTIVEVSGSLHVNRAASTNASRTAASSKATSSKANSEKAASKQEESADKKTSSKQLQIPLKLDAEMFFDELGVDGDSFPTLRHYWNAKTDFEVNKVADQRELRQDRQLVLMTGGTSAMERFTSPNGPLSREEIDLIDVPSSGFPPERLLPNRSVALKESWTLEDQIAAELLRIESVESGSLTSQVQEITEDNVSVSLEGTIEGLVDGVKTKIETKGNYRFDRTSKMVSWIALALREKRDVGLAVPGFHVVSRVRTAREAIDNSDALTPAVLRTVNVRPNENDRLLDFSPSGGGFQMAMDRRWHVLTNRQFSSTLRMVEDDALIATCRIDQLTKGVAGTQITLDGFRADVQNALAKNCKEIESASQSVSSQGVRALRVVANGQVAKTPIKWVYYHLSDDDGRRLSVIFTLESSMLSRFEGIDGQLTSSVLFLDPKEADDEPREELTKREKAGTRR